jgi:hypothetical protein
VRFHAPAGAAIVAIDEQILPLGNVAIHSPSPLNASEYEFSPSSVRGRPWARARAPP